MKTALGIVQIVMMIRNAQRIATIIINKDALMKLLFPVAVTGYVMRMLRNTQIVQQIVLTATITISLLQTVLTTELRNVSMLLLIILLMILKAVSKIGTFMMQKESQPQQPGPQ